MTVNIEVLLTAPVAASLEATPLVVLAKAPGTALATSMVMVQVEPAPIVPPDKLIALDPALVPLSVPPQLLVTVGALLTTRLVAKASENATPVRAIGLGLLMIRLRVEVPLVRIVAGLNDPAMVGFCSTCRVAVLLVSRVPDAVCNAPVVLA